MPEKAITLSQFQSVAPGMTYAEVVELLGREGTLDSRTDGSDDPVVASYYWWNANGSYMEAAFENDRLVYKQQSRLGIAGARARPAAANGGKATPPPVVTGADLQKILAKGMAICGTVVIAAVALLPGPAPEPTDVDLFLPGAILVASLMSLPRGTPSAGAQWAVNVGGCGIIFILAMLAVSVISPGVGGFVWYLIFLFWCVAMTDVESPDVGRWVAGFFAVVSCAGSVLLLI